MNNQILFFLVLLLVIPSVAYAQAPDPADAVSAALVADGYDVIAAGFFPDDSGQPLKDTVYAQLDTITTDLDDNYVVNQAINSFIALNRYYPNATSLIAVLQYDRFQLIFQTTARDLTQLRQGRVSDNSFWSRVRSGARIYDTVAKRYVGEHDFSNSTQTDKNETTKDFTGGDQNPNPIPTPTANTDTRPEHILLEPSTTYLPADGSSEATLLATLSDHDFNALPGRGVNFVYEVRGQEDKNLGNASTDAYGAARAHIHSSAVLNVVLLRATTALLNAQTKILVGAAPRNSRSAQLSAVRKGLESQGYSVLEIDQQEYTGSGRQSIRVASAVVTLVSKTFDRAVYSELSRSFGTLRTVFTDSNYLEAVLAYKSRDGHDYLLVYSVNAADWDAYVRGDIGEIEFWQRVEYAGALDENGNRVGDKDFINKDFGAAPGRTQTNTPRTVEAALTSESWGEQLTTGSFQVPIGATADGFTLADLGGSATGFAIYATPDYEQPVFHFRQGDDPAPLQDLRLNQGQYILNVEAPNAPAHVQLSYTEHLAQ